MLAAQRDNRFPVAANVRHLQLYSHKSGVRLGTAALHDESANKLAGLLTSDLSPTASTWRQIGNIVKWRFIDACAASGPASIIVVVEVKSARRVVTCHHYQTR